MISGRAAKICSVFRKPVNLMTSLASAATVEWESVQADGSTCGGCGQGVSGARMGRGYERTERRGQQMRSCGPAGFHALLLRRVAERVLLIGTGSALPLHDFLPRIVFLPHHLLTRLRSLHSVRIRN
jgi:hypothetical protein